MVGHGQHRTVTKLGQDLERREFKADEHAQRGPNLRSGFGESLTRCGSEVAPSQPSDAITYAY